MTGFDATYQPIGDYPSGDAARARRAVTADGAEVINETVHATGLGGPSGQGWYW